MRSSTMTAREFNQHVSRAKKAAKDGPVIITERGKPAFVLQSHEHYAARTGSLGASKSLAELITDDGPLDFEVEFPRSDFRSKVPNFE